MAESFICDYVRSSIGRYGGSLASIRPDDLAALAIKELRGRNESIDWDEVDDVIFGCANQSGEDSRNVARMAALLAGLPIAVPGTTINRLCGSGLDAVLMASRAIRCGEADIVVAGGVESMTRAPLVMPKADAPFSRNVDIFDSTIGWRFVNTAMKKQYGVDSMPETAENLAEAFGISRADQDWFAVRSQNRAVASQKSGRLAQEIFPISIPKKNSDPIVVQEDEHPRDGTSFEALSKLPTPFRTNGTVTAGNSSGINDGAAALLIASDRAVAKFGLVPIARVVGGASAGVEPRIMGIGPVPATRRLCHRLNLKPSDFDVIELNEAFASQSIAVLRELGIAEDAEHVNPNGGAIALGHPLGMSGARLAGTLAMELKLRDARYGLATMCIGVGQGIAVVLERS